MLLAGFPKVQYSAQHCSPCTPMTYQVLLPLALSLSSRMTRPFIALGTLLIKAVTSLSKTLSELNSLCLENSLIPHSGKKRSYAIDEKTSHRVAKFCGSWRGSERLSETHSSFGYYYRGKLSWSLDHLTNAKKKKRILLTN